MASAIVAAGLTFSVGTKTTTGTAPNLVDGLPSSYTAIGLVKNFSGPELSTATIDVTHLLSTSREYLTSPIKNNGKCSFSIWLSPNDTQHKQLRTAVGAGTKLGFKCELSDGSSSEFLGFVETFKITSGGVDDAVSCDVEIIITGDVTYTDAP